MDTILCVFIAFLALGLCSGLGARGAAQRMGGGSAAIAAHPCAESRLPRMDCFLPFGAAKHQRKTPTISAGPVEKLVRELQSHQVCINIPKPSYSTFYFFSILEI